MLGFISQITDKPGWDDKVFDEGIVQKWRHEATSQYTDFTNSMFDYRLTPLDQCMKELREKAQKLKETGMVAVIDTEATVVKSDTAVPPELCDALRAAAFRLEDVPDKVKDWHPHTNKRVLDLLHPSLFPLVYGETKVLPTGTVPLAKCAEFTGKGERTDPVRISEQTTSIFRRKANHYTDDDMEYLAAWDGFQWLPSDVHFGADGKAKITSYINNLHPTHHEDLYRVLEQMIDRTIPLWNETVSWFQNRSRITIDQTGQDDWERPEGAKSPVRGPLEDVERQTGEDPGYYDRMEDEYQERYDNWFRSVRVLKIPEPDDYRPFSETTSQRGAHWIDLREKFKGSGLQVIFKLANIHLDPSNPEYDGGTWHVEGALNEHICATALYYYDQENITDNSLSFRQSISSWDLMMKAEQDGEPGTLIQVLGSVATRAGRLLAFPNVLQHRVSSFKLTDPTRPGHRKILAMFLVDPHIRVLSTANVPPQRRDWWAEELRGTVPRLAALPAELFAQIISHVDDPWDMERAEQIREELMSTRGGINDQINEDMDEADVTFCEH
ncbi:hypothetical protein SLS62_005234 [Diatrype stigma]|uniref:Uncharacterized protein n=1 Tax=Diatrype stigma TaxID=117547 RepID=A0AAN9URY1_9PEZI